MKQAGDDVVVTAGPSQGPVFITGDEPVSEDQVRQKLQSEGWSNVQIVREGRYIEAVGSKDGQTSKVVVNAQARVFETRMRTSRRLP
jgi:hypothetical protein